MIDKILEPVESSDVVDNHSYTFTDEELDTLALFLRKNAHNLPEELDLFSKFVEYSIYNKMTIAEAESFFNEV